MPASSQAVAAYPLGRTGQITWSRVCVSLIAACCALTICWATWSRGATGAAGLRAVLREQLGLDCDDLELGASAFTADEEVRELARAGMLA
ncbi:MAG: hypothetical protein ACRDRO_29715 [Pseudonocardiaceae bacterium]